MASWKDPGAFPARVFPAASDHSSMLKPWTWPQEMSQRLRNVITQRYMPMGPTGRMKMTSRFVSLDRMISVAISSPISTSMSLTFWVATG